MFLKTRPCSSTPSFRRIVDKKLQAFLLDLIDRKIEAREELDDFQYFEIYLDSINGENILRVVHLREDLSRETYFVSGSTIPINAVFVTVHNAGDYAEMYSTK